MSRRPPPSVPRTDFGPAPPGYVPGLGRGAVGFTTRSDIGPARPMAEELTAGRGRSLPVPPMPAGFGARGVPTVAAPDSAAAAGGSAAKATDDAEIAKYSDSNFDEFAGYNEQLFASGEYDAEDKEADLIYDAIDRRMDSRRKRRREESLKAELEKTTKMPQIAAQFAEIKRTLKDISQEAWENIPEAADYSHQNKLRKAENLREKFTPLPDSIIMSGAANIAEMNQTNMIDEGRTTPAAAAAASAASAAAGLVAPDLTSIGRARDKMLSMKLDRMADSVSGQTVVDPKGYMTQLGQTKSISDAEVSDVKKAKLLLRSVIQTNPKHGPGWIAAARLEKETGKISQARQIILKGCEMAPTNEDVWLEAAAMQTPQNARAILAKAVMHLPTSVNIWMMAANLETEVEQQKAVLRRALEHLPTSVRLWKTAVELESPDDARIMLSRAVELVPESVEMWLALARLESYEQARIVLNRARKAIPTDASIWITAAKLEEAQGNSSNVDAIIAKAVKSLSKSTVVIDRDSWINAAEEAEKAGALITCNAIVKHTIGLGVEELDRMLTWTNDALVYETKGAFGVAKAIAAHLCATFPKKKSVWLRAAQLERAHGTPESLDALLKRAVVAAPQAEILWLMSAKLQWTRGDVAAARSILNQAFEANKNSEEIWLAAMKLEFESKAYDRARMLLSKARDAAQTPRVWMKSALVERLLHNTPRERELLQEGLKLFPAYPKLHIMLGQLLHREGEIAAAREAFKAGVRAVGAQSVDMWLVYAQFELAVGTKAAGIKQETQVKAESTTTKAETKEQDGGVVKMEDTDSAVTASTAAAAASSAAAAAAPSASQLLVANPYAKARSILETARLKIPHSPALWLAAIRLELLAASAPGVGGGAAAAASAGARKSADWLLAKSLQACPTAGLLWAQAIAMDDRPKKKSRSFEALERCNEDAFVLLAVAKLFWLGRKIANARSWFQRAVDANKDFGDAWCFFLRFEQEHGDEASRARVIEKAVEAEPSHGEIWCSVSKDDRYAQLKTKDILLKAVAKLPTDVFYTLAPV